MPREWFEEFFADLGEDFDRIFAARVARTAEDTDSVEAALQLPKGSTILDLCCGTGRVSLELGRRGYRVLGVDLSPSLLAIARRRAQAEHLRVTWARCDMRRLPYRARFDAVINLFTSFGYFEEVQDDLQVLKGIRRALKPGGRFLLEISNSVWVVRNFQPRGWVESESVLVLEERTLDLAAGMIRSRWQIRFPDGRQLQRDVNTRIYLPTELARLMRSAGLLVQAWWGDAVGTPLALESRRLWVLATAA